MQELSLDKGNFEFQQLPASKMSMTTTSFGRNIGAGTNSSLDRSAMEFVARNSGIQRLLQQSMAEA